MSNITTLPKQQSAIPALAMSEEELRTVLRNSLYPGAKDESIGLVINYCRAAGLDPMQKPVHIVPMSVSTGEKDSDGWDKKVLRDVIMPGIGLYRTQASRSGEYAGITDPEFGDDISETLDGVSITYPKWCKVVVKRLMPSGQIVEFSAKELWKENYATKSTKSDAPNAMWRRRPYAQIAKCAESQALRKAFPEVGAQPTAEEMEGKTLDDNVVDMETGEVTRRIAAAATPKSPPALPDYSDKKFEETFPVWQQMIADGKSTAQKIIDTVGSRYALSDHQVNRILDIGAAGGEE